MGKNYPQTFLEECKYAVKKNKMRKFTNDELDLDSSNKTDELTNLMKKIV